MTATDKDKECSSLEHYVGWNREIREKQAEKYSEKVRERREGTGMNRVVEPEAGENRGRCNEAVKSLWVRRG